MTARALAALALLALGAACGGKSIGGPIAELVKADGPVERELGTGPWSAAPIGTGFALGDAARTADGGAQLMIGGGSARIAMQPRTVLRFGAGGKGAGSSRISVELGAIDLAAIEGSGAYTLDIGDVKLGKNGSIRITAKGHGQSALELTGGEATVTSNGQTLDLAVGKPIELALDVPVDAGAPAAAIDAPPPPPIDAAPPLDAPPVETDARLEVTGKKVELQAPGETTWKPVTEATTLPKGATIRVGAGSTARLVSGGATVELATGGRAAIGPDLAIDLEAGAARATVPASGAAKIIVPGGGLGLRGDAQGGAEVRVDIGRETKIAVGRGATKLTGATGAELDMSRGESATITRAGLIHPLEAIPTYVDFRLAAGETSTIHDPKGATAVQFDFAGKCGGGGVVELDRDARFRSSKVSAGKDTANLLVTGGAWAYRVRCTTASGDEGAAVASGRIAVVRDDGRRALPKAQPTNDLDADGRTWRVSYQSVVPNLRFLYKGPSGGTLRLHLASGGKDETFDGDAKITVPGTRVHEGTYTYWFDRDGVRDAKVSTLVVDFDQTAPQVYIESPADGIAWTGDLEVRGAVLVGWTAAVDTITIPMDAQRRFAAKVAPPTSQRALAIRLSHPQRGVHYYLRRGAAK